MDAGTAATNLIKRQTQDVYAMFTTPAAAAAVAETAANWLGSAFYNFFAFRVLALSLFSERIDVDA